MPKAKSAYLCQSCGHSSPKWLGQCPDCGEWNTLVEEVVRASVGGKAVERIAIQAPDILSVQSLDARREPTGIPALDAVLGGGLVPGSVVLVGGEPGIGKSTLLTQVAAAMAHEGEVVLYISGEESPSQVRMRAERIGALSENFRLATSTDLEEALGILRGTEPRVAIVDSIQTMSSSELEGGAGGVSQVRHCASVLHAFAKEAGIAMFVVGHVTKDGSLAGPKVLEHLVDCVLVFEGEGFGRLRTIRAAKNRFGSVDELAVFEMTESGLSEVENPSQLLLAERQAGAPGSCVFAAMEGRRAVLLEVQALVSPNYTQSPRRTVTGLDFNRVLLTLGVLEKRGGVRLAGQDVFVSVVGGLTVREPAADLAVLLAVASAAKGAALPEDLVVFGEVGLTGEIRSVGSVEARLKEAARMGFRRAATSRTGKQDYSQPGVTVGGLRNIADALSLVSE